ncbi:hypothetical protein HK096_011593, partial [Nowakowskiella sp. JEL0078]
YADITLLSLIHNLIVKRELSYLLVIGIWTGRNIPAHSTMGTVIKQIEILNPAAVLKFELGPLDLKSLQEYLSFTLRPSVTDCHSLATLILSKTMGNPLHVLGHGI